MKIAYLCAANTLPGASPRHGGGPDHDRMADQLRSALSKLDGGELVEIAWDDPRADWAQYDAALIGSPWDYIDRPEDFLTALDQIEADTQLFNPMLFVRWNARKTYLSELAGLGAGTVSTVWLHQPTEAALAAAFKVIGEDEIVLKPQIGAGAKNQYRVRKGDPLPDTDVPMMAQAFFASIQEEGEFSFIYVDGELSHTVLKKPKADDYRVQSHYGGTTELISPTKTDLAAADKVMDCLDATPLYARVDMIRRTNGELALMELEAIEPYLFPEHAPDLGDKIISALQKRLTAI